MAILSIFSAWTSETSFFNTFPSATIWILGIITLTAVIISYYAVKFSYWRSKNIDGPPPTIIFGNSLTIFQPGHERDVNWIKTYGKVYGFYQGVNPVLSVADPEILKDILVRDFPAFADRQGAYHKIQKHSLISSNGKRWKDQRAIISPTFTSGKLKAMHGLIKHCVMNLTDHIEKNMKDNCAVFDNKTLYGNLTMDVIAKCAFATDTNAHNGSENNVMLKNLFEFFNFNLYKVLLAALLPEFVKKATRLSIVPKDSLEFLVKTSELILEQRKKGGNQKFNDLLQLMLEAEKTLEDGSIDRLTDVEIIANIILVLIAGYETTGSLLTYCTYSLALNQEVQEKLRNEIREAVEKDSGEIKYDTIMSLKYLDAVINETLRLYPPVVRIERKATTDYYFEKLGYKISKGMKIHIPIYAIHRREEYHPNPDLFNPDRFMPENKDQLVPYTFLPFVLGPRNCIGARFALLEAKTALASVLLKYRVVPDVKTEVPLDFSATLAILKPKSVILKYEKIDA